MRYSTGMHLAARVSSVCHSSHGFLYRPLVKVMKLTRQSCCTVDEDLIKETADLMVSTGLKKAGYQYLVIDGAPAYQDTPCPTHC